MQSQTRAAAIAALALVLSGGLAAGCGGDSGSAEDQFLGRWFYEPPDPQSLGSTGFTMSCTDPIFMPVFPSGSMTQFLVFPSLTFEHGELTDLVETSGNCPIIDYEIKGNTAVPPNPDPYIDDAPACLVQFNLSDTAGNPVAAAAVLSPSASWTFKLLPDKTASGARRAQLIGSASAHLIADNGTAAGAVSNPDCTYAGSDTFFRVTQP
jgi:hypothetical protein